MRWFRASNFLKHPIESFVFILFIAFYGYIASLGILQSDTKRILDTLPAIDACLLGGNLKTCKSLSWFAPLQFLNASLLFRLGYDLPGITIIFILLNAAAFGWILIHGYSYIYRSAPISAILFFIALVFSPAVTYSGTTFAEILVALGAVATYFGLIEERFLLAFCGALLAGLGKDVSLFLIPVFTTLLHYSYSMRGKPRIRRGPLFAVFAGIALAAIVGGWFNFVRFGSLTNAFYNAPGMKVTDFTVIKSSFLAYFFLPLVAYCTIGPCFYR